MICQKAQESKGCPLLQVSIQIIRFYQQISEISFGEGVFICSMKILQAVYVESSFLEAEPKTRTLRLVIY